MPSTSSFVPATKGTTKQRSFPIPAKALEIEKEREKGRAEGERAGIISG